MSRRWAMGWCATGILIVVVLIVGRGCGSRKQEYAVTGWVRVNMSQSAFDVENRIARPDDQDIEAQGLILRSHRVLSLALNSLREKHPNLLMNDLDQLAARRRDGFGYRSPEVG